MPRAALCLEAWRRDGRFVLIMPDHRNVSRNNVTPAELLNRQLDVEFASDCCYPEI